MDEMTPQQAMTIYGHLIDDPTTFQVLGISLSGGSTTTPYGVVDGWQVPERVFSVAMGHQGERVTWRQLFEEAGMIPRAPTSAPPSAP